MGGANRAVAVGGVVLLVGALALGVVRPTAGGSVAAEQTATLTVSVSGPGVVRTVGSTAIACGKRCSVSLPIGSLVALEAAPSSGKRLDGWKGACSGVAVRCDVVLDESTSVTAAFGDGPRPPEWRLRVTSAGSGTVVSDVAGLISCPPKCSTALSRGTVALSAAPGSGSVFAGWRGDCAGTGSCRVEFSAAHDVLATFRPAVVSPGSSQLRVTNPYPRLPGTTRGTRAEGTIVVGTSPCPSAPTTQTNVTCTYTVANGTLVTLKAELSSGGFANWKGSCGGEVPTCVVTVGAATSVSAQFFSGIPLETFPGINVSRSGEGRLESSPPGISCGPLSGCSAAFEPKQKVKLTALPSSRSYVARWGGDRSDCKGASCTAIAGVDRAVSVTFALIRDRLAVSTAGDGGGTITSQPAGITCGGACSSTFVRGTAVRLRATAATNSRFVGWNGACSGAGVCAVTLNANASVTARFDRIRDLVRVAKSGGGAGTITSLPAGISCGAACAARFPRASTVVLRAVAAGSSRFAGWQGACSGTGDCRIVVAGQASATARFDRISDELRVEKTGPGRGRVVSSPPGISCGDDCRAAFSRGTEVVLTAVPEPASRFVAWGGACAGAASCRITLSGPTRVQARFARICAASSARGFGVAVAKNPRRILVAVRLDGPAAARLRLWRGQTRVAQKVLASVASGARQLRLDVPRSAGKGGYRIVLRLADSCGAVRLFQKQITLPK